MELRGLSQVSSKIGLIVFLSGVATGRIFGGFVTKREKILDLIILSFGVSAVTLSILFLIDVRGLNQILVFLSGTAISAIFPLLITLAGTIYREVSGTVLGLMKLALPAGGMLIPAILSLISKYGSFGVSLVMFPVIALSGLLILSLNRKAFSVPSCYPRPTDMEKRGGLRSGLTCVVCARKYLSWGIRCRIELDWMPPGDG
jgi:fucose permease